MDSIPVFNHTKHRELWQWLSEHPKADKEDAFIALFGFPAPRAHCYACAACEELMRATSYATIPRALDCRLCPLEWPGGECEFYRPSGKGLYWQWADLKTTPAERADLARQIRDLPVKPDWPGKII